MTTTEPIIWINVVMKAEESYEKSNFSKAAELRGFKACASVKAFNLRVSSLLKRLQFWGHEMIQKQ